MKPFSWSNYCRVARQYAMLVFACFLLSHCYGDHEYRGASIPIAEKTVAPPQQDTFLNGFYRYIIDTTRQFPDIETLLALRNQLGQQLWAYKQYFLQHSKRSDAGFIADSVTQYEQEMFMVSLYKHLYRLPKKQTSFNMLNVLEYAHLVSAADKEALFNLYPAAMRTSAKGKALLAKLLPLKAHQGMSLTGLGNQLLTDPQGKKASLAGTMAPEQTLLVLGASWCSPCRHQDRIIEKLVHAQQIDTTKTRILYLSVDEKPANWQRFIASFEPGNQLYLLSGGLNSPLLKKLSIIGIPHYILLDNTMTITLEGEHIKDILPAIAPGVDLNTIF